MNDIDLTTINQIDTECDFADDSDDMIIRESVSAARADDPADVSSERNLVRHTGVMISFDDDDSETIVQKPIVVSEVSDLGHKETAELPMDGAINAIDMECSIGEDDDFDTPKLSQPSEKDPEDFSEKELVNDLVIEESSETNHLIDQGTVEDDYYNKLKRKHQATNKKGAYNWHFHFAGNPKLEMDDFNKGFGRSEGSGKIAAAPVVADGPSMATDGLSFGEQKCDDTAKYSKLFEELLDITGFALVDNTDKACKFKDTYAGTEKICNNLDEVKEFLDPYIQDFFIIPLEVETQQNFPSYAD